MQIKNVEIYSQITLKYTMNFERYLIQRKQMNKIKLSIIDSTFTSCNLCHDDSNP